MIRSNSDEIAPATLQFAGIMTIGLVAVLAACLFFFWIAYSPPNPLSPQWTPDEQLNFKTVFPEGWAFFTRDPRQEAFSLYSRTADGDWSNGLLGPASQASQLFGWSRISRAQGLDVGEISYQLSERNYKTCVSANPQACLAKLPAVVQIRNDASHPLICGHTVLLWRQPVPWSWSSFRSITLKARVANLNVHCDGH